MKIKLTNMLKGKERKNRYAKLVKVKSLSRVRLFATPWTVAYYVLSPWDFPGKITGVGCHFLLPTSMLRGKERKKEYICKVKQT